MKELTVKVLRGLQRVGENLIEVTDGETKILLECGVALNETKQTKELENLVVERAYDCVIVTHCHADHSGLLKRRLAANMIYIGEATFETLQYCKAVHADNLSKIRFFQSEVPFSVGEIDLRAYLCDHSAYDSYMIELSKGGETVLYTGDFRANGRKNFSALLSRLPDRVDCLITERTNLRMKNKTERDLEDEAVEWMRRYSRVFILQSALNADRTVSFYRASVRDGRAFIMSYPAAEVAGRYGNIPNLLTFSGCYTYLSKPLVGEAYQRSKTSCGERLWGRDRIALTQRFSMQIHSGMLPYLQKMNEKRSLRGSLLIYSMWEGYQESMQAFWDGVRELGIDTVNLHVSGHADRQTVARLVAHTNPKEIFIVHSEKGLFSSCQEAIFML